MLIERKEFVEESGKIGYVESVFESGNVLKTTYFPESQRLYIAFNRGHTYSYGNISQDMYNEFESNESQGIFFQKRINNNSRYPFRKEFTLYPTEVTLLKEIITKKRAENDNNE